MNCIFVSLALFVTATMAVLLVRSELNFNIAHQVFFPLALVSAFLLRRALAMLATERSMSRPLHESVAALVGLKVVEQLAFGLFFCAAEFPELVQATVGATGVLVLAVGLLVLVGSFLFALNAVLFLIALEWGLSVLHVPRSRLAAVLLASASLTYVTLTQGWLAVVANCAALAILFLQLGGGVRRQTATQADVEKQETLRRCRRASLLYFAATLAALLLQFFADRFVTVATLVLTLEVSHLLVLHELLAAFSGRSGS
jgi:hypothetical protein